MASAQSQIKTTSKMVLFINPNNTTKISQLLTQINWANLTGPGGGGFDNFSWAPDPNKKITQTIKSLGLEEMWPKVKDDEGVSHFSYGISYRKGANKWAGGVETMYHPASSSGEGSAMCTFSPPTAASFAQLAMPVCVIIEPLWVTADEDEAEASADAKPTFAKAKAALVGKENILSRKRSSSQVDLTSDGGEDEEVEVEDDDEEDEEEEDKGSKAKGKAKGKGKGKAKGKGANFDA
jgi:hypothetical protein